LAGPPFSFREGPFKVLAVKATAAPLLQSNSGHDPESANLGTNQPLVCSVRSQQQVAGNGWPTFAALFYISVAKDVLLHCWAGIRTQLPLLSGAGSLRPENLIGAMAADAQGTTRPGLQRIGVYWLD